MANISITLDELITSLKKTNIAYESVDLCDPVITNGNYTVGLRQSIENFDFITLEFGDNQRDNPDNGISTFVTKSITYGMVYTNIAADINGTKPGDGGALPTNSGWASFAFSDDETLVIVYSYNHNLLSVRGWKSGIKWGGALENVMFDFNGYISIPPIRVTRSDYIDIDVPSIINSNGAYTPQFSFKFKILYDFENDINAFWRRNYEISEDTYDRLSQFKDSVKGDLFMTVVLEYTRVDDSGHRYVTRDDKSVPFRMEIGQYEGYSFMMDPGDTLSSANVKVVGVRIAT